MNSFQMLSSSNIDMQESASIQKQRVEKHYWEFLQLFLRKIEIRSPKMWGLNLDRVQSVSNIIWVGYIYPCSIMRGCLVPMYVYCKHFNINNEELHKIANYLRFVGANHHPLLSSKIVLYIAYNLFWTRECTKIYHVLCRNKMMFWFFTFQLGKCL